MHFALALGAKVVGWADISSTLRWPGLASAKRNVGVQRGNDRLSRAVCGLQACSACSIPARSLVDASRPHNSDDRHSGKSGPLGIVKTASLTAMATQSASSVSSLAFGTFGTLTAGGSQTPSSVSSSSVPPPGTLTTIFTPPADCFSAPETWQPCGIQDGETRCYWSQAYTCYPAEGHPISSIVWGLESSLFPAIYRYSPGVLPSGYTTQTVYSGAVGGGTESVAVGCPS